MVITENGLLLDSNPFFILEDMGAIGAPEIDDVAFSTRSKRNFSVLSSHRVMHCRYFDIQARSTMGAAYNQNFNTGGHIFRGLSDSETKSHLAELHSISVFQFTLLDAAPVQKNAITTA